MQIYECGSCRSIFEFDSAATGGRCPDCLNYDLISQIEAKLISEADLMKKTYYTLVPPALDSITIGFDNYESGIKD